MYGNKNTKTKLLKKQVNIGTEIYILQSKLFEVAYESIVNPNPYPNVIPIVSIVWWRQPTLPIKFFGVTENMYCGINPELTPIIIPKKNLPINKGTKDKW